jgi:DNA-binding beta-propeller fold protein YncE
MKNRPLQHVFKLSVVTLAAVLAVSASAELQVRKVARQELKDDDENRRDRAPLATGQFVTPTMIKDSVQQYLNPGLASYPDFIAGEAVKSQLSPDGTTLAIVTAGQNSLYKPDGTVDVANSTQYLFLYNVAGANKARPLLMQAIKQVNAHVGLVFSPDGNTIYAAGGNDDAVYVYTKSGGSFTAAGTYGISPVQVLHWNGRTWKAELSLGKVDSVDLTGLTAVSADDAWVTGLYVTNHQTFIKHWDGTRWRNLPLGPAGHIRPLASVGLTVTSDGSIAALDTQGLTDRANFLWLRCQH